MSEQTEMLERLMRKYVDDAPKFKPRAFMNGLGDLVILWKDCSTYADPFLGLRRVSIIRHMHTNKVVGLEIARARNFLPSSFIARLSH